MFDDGANERIVTTRRCLPHAENISYFGNGDDALRGKADRFLTPLSIDEQSDATGPCASVTPRAV